MGKKTFYQNGHKKGSHKCSQGKEQKCSSSLCRDCGDHFVVRSDVLGKIICKKCFRPFEKKGEKSKYEKPDVIVLPRQTLVLGTNKNRSERKSLQSKYDSRDVYADEYADEDDYDYRDEDEDEDGCLDCKYEEVGGCSKHDDYTLYQMMCPSICEICNEGPFKCSCQDVTDDYV